jgi:hypothetical protein
MSCSSAKLAILPSSTYNEPFTDLEVSSTDAIETMSLFLDKVETQHQSHEAFITVFQLTLLKSGAALWPNAD